MTQNERDVFLVALTHALPGLPPGRVAELGRDLINTATGVAALARFGFLTQAQETRETTLRHHFYDLARQVNAIAPKLDPPTLWLVNEWVEIPTRRKSS